MGMYHYIVMNIRRFHSGDETDIANIYNESFSHWISSLGSKYEYFHIGPSDVFAWLSKNNDGFDSIWITEIDGMIVGYVQCFLHSEKGEHEIKVLNISPNDWNMGQSNLAISAEFRRKGIASALLDFCEKFAFEKGAKIVFVQLFSDNIDASRVLIHRGYTHNEFHYYSGYSESEPIACDSVYAYFDLSKEIPIIHYNDQIIVRPANLNDINDIRILSILSATWVDPLLFTEKWIRDYILGFFGNTVLVAELDGRVVGVMDFMESRCRIGIAGVLPEYRRMGIGYTLFYELLKAMQIRGLDEAIADTGVTQQDAIHMYERFGMEIKRRQHIWIKEVG
jgi:ribosomal protein S18 acetylase RimI-like enzyme